MDNLIPVQFQGGQTTGATCLLTRQVQVRQHTVARNHSIPFTGTIKIDKASFSKSTTVPLKAQQSSVHTKNYTAIQNNGTAASTAQVQLG